MKRTLIDLLYAASQRLESEFTKGGSDLTPRQRAVLAAVAAGDGMSQTEIVEVTGIDRSTLADIVARLMKIGLLARHRSKVDARAYVVRITEVGKDALRQGNQALGGVAKLAASALTLEEREILARFLERLSEAK